MTLPASLLVAAEAHGCFTGAYAHASPVSVAIDPAQPPVTLYQAKCDDCLLFHLGALASLLPVGMAQYGLAQELSAHMRTVRGYRWAMSGWHQQNSNGFWLNAAYYGDGLFLVDGARNNGGTQEVALLIQAFRDRVAHPEEPGMLDPANYTCDVAHLSCSPPLGPVRTKQDILRSPQCSVASRQGLRRVCIVEYLPLASKISLTSVTSVASAAPSQTQSSSANSSTPSPAGSSAAAPVGTLRIGDTCPKCKQEFRERPLFSGSFIGCLC